MGPFAAFDRASAYHRDIVMEVESIPVIVKCEFLYSFLLKVQTSLFRYTSLFYLSLIYTSPLRHPTDLFPNTVGIQPTHHIGTRYSKSAK